MAKQGDSLDYRRFDAVAAECDSEEETDAQQAGGNSADTSSGGGGKKKAPLPVGGIDNADLSTLFWDSVPENADEHPDKLAIDALLEEDTLEERAANLKRVGNEKLKVAQTTKQKLYYREAISYYTQGLDLKCLDLELNAILYSNRAQVNLTLGNNKKALEDAEAAIALNPNAIKSYFRAASAALKTGKWVRCSELCQAGLALDPGAAELEKVAKEAAKVQREQEEVEQRALKEQRAAKTAAVSLAMAIAGRGWQLGRSQFSVGTSSKPTIDEEGMIHWPVVFMYPEVMTNDCIEDFHEAVPISAHLDQMFGEDAPPLEWDERGEYKRHTVELYYLADCAKPMQEDHIIQVLMGQTPEGFVDDGPKRYGTKSARWVRVAEEDALGQVLQRPDYVIPGVPVLFVVASGTQFRDRFLANDTKAWRA